jgi:membrane-associated protease RseP (regulator of RpoE activity)
MPYIVVQLRINQSPPLPFLVDTGSSTALIVSDTVRDRLSLKVVPSAPGKGDSPSVKQLAAAEVEWQTLSGDPYPMTVSPVSAPLPAREDDDGRPIAGIVGMPLLKGTGVTVNFDTGVLTLRQGTLQTSPSLPSSGSIRIPVSQEPGGRHSVRLRTDVETDVTALIDTGSYYTVLDSDITGTPDNSEATPVKVTIADRTTGTKVSDALYIFHDVGFLSSDPDEEAEVFEEKDLLVFLPSEATSVLGLSWLSRHNFDLDYSSKTLTLFRPVSTANEGMFGGKIGRRQLPGTVGMRIARDTAIDSPPSWRITHVYDNEPAAKAGLHVGDRIITLDGVPLPSDTVLAQKLLDGFAGTAAKLVVETAQKQTVMVKVPREKNTLGTISAAIDLGGQIGQRYSDNVILIASVEEEKPMAKAGLRKGDEILTISGRSVEAMSWRGIYAALQNSAHGPVSISYRRDGVVASVELYEGSKRGILAR